MYFELLACIFPIWIKDSLCLLISPSSQNERWLKTLWQGGILVYWLNVLRSSNIPTMPYSKQKHLKTPTTIPIAHQVGTFPLLDPPKVSFWCPTALDHNVVFVFGIQQILPSFLESFFLFTSYWDLFLALMYWNPSCSTTWIVGNLFLPNPHHPSQFLLLFHSLLHHTT